jgi:iron complex transport system ATP-binding protein
MISLSGVSYSYRAGSEALRDISFEAASPQLIAIAGPNGSGKSTLLDVVAGLKMPSQGHCRIQGRETSAYARPELCRILAHVPQQIPQGVPFTVEQVVLTGRTPYGRGLYDSADDLLAASSAIERAGVASLRQRRYSALSGGEQQRVLLAAAICQSPTILLLDEPGAHLDPRNDAWLWTLLRELTSEGRLVAIVTHHLALAARYADRVLLMRDGRLCADGSAEDALAPERLSDVFGVPFHRVVDTEGRVYLTHGY